MTETEARQILGLSEDANAYEIESRFTLLSRGLYRDTSPEGQEKTERLIEAYDLLRGYERPKLQRSARDEEVIFGKKRYEWRTFFDYGWRPAIAVLLLVLIVGSILFSVLTHRNPDLDIAYVGAYRYLDERRDFSEQERLNQALLYGQGAQAKDSSPGSSQTTSHVHTSAVNLEKLPYVAYDLLSLYEGIDPQMEQAMLTKMSLFTAGAKNVDLMFCDSKMFTRYARQGFFQALDANVDELKDPLSEGEVDLLYERVYATPEDDPEAEAQPIEDAHIYGLKLKGTWPAGLGIYGDEYILAFPKFSQHSELAKDWWTRVKDQKEHLQMRFDDWLKSLLASEEAKAGH